jgi:hypothetical protein
MLERTRKKLLNLVSSGKLSPYEQNALIDIYKRDCYRPVTLTQKQTLWINRLHHKAFEQDHYDASKSRSFQLPDKLGDFEIVLAEDGNCYIEFRGLRSSVPLGRRFAREILQFLHETQRGGALQEWAESLTRKENNTTDVPSESIDEDIFDDGSFSGEEDPF